MKNAKKIIAFLCILAVVCTGVIISVLAAKTEALYTIEQCREKIDAANAITTGAYDKSLALETAYEYYAGTDPEAEGYADLTAALDSANKSLITECVTASETESDSAKRADNIALAVKQISKHPVSDTVLTTRVKDEAIKVLELLLEEYKSILSTVTDSDDKYRERTYHLRCMNLIVKAAESEGLLSEIPAYADFIEEYMDAKEAYDAYVLQLRENIDINVELGEFKGIVSVDEFDKKTPNFSSMGKDQVTRAKKYDGDNFYLYIQGNEDGGEPGVAGESHMKTTLPGVGSPLYGCVYEFDLAFFDDARLDGGVHIKGFSRNSNGGVKIYPYFFHMNANGDIIKPKTDEVVVTNPFVRGEWVHISVAVDALTYEVDLYVDYKYVCSYDGDGGTGTQQVSTFSDIYMGAASSSGTLAIDKLTVYDGSAPRTSNRFSGEGSASESKFVYYSKVFANANVAEPLRVLAYEAATELIGEFWDDSTNGYKTEDAAIRDAVDKYFAFDKDKMYLTYRKNNLAKYKELVDVLEAVERKPDTLAKRKGHAANVTAFLSSVKNEVYDDFDGYGLADGETPKLEYRAYAFKFAKLEAQIVAEDAIIEFTNTSIIFKGASTEAKMREYYQILKDTVKSLELSLIIEKVEEIDPETGNPVLVDKYIETTKFQDFLEAYKVYVDGDNIIDRLIAKTNSKDFVGFFGQIKDYDTPELWEENYEKLNKYVVILRDMELVGKFYDDYPNLAEYRATFAVMEREYFYPRLQREFIDYLTNIINLLLETDSYVEKMGYCQVIKNYIAKNEVYFEEGNEELEELCARFEVYEREVSVQEGDYNDLLEQNTIYFINKANQLATCVTYAEKRLAYDLATAYYYAMNVGSAEAQAAIAIYERVGDELELIDECSAGLKAAVVRLSAAETVEDKYAALVDCCANAKYASEDIEGVTEALAEYQEAYDEYNVAINGAREDLDCSVTVVGSLRYICGVGAIMQRIINMILR